MGPKTWTLGSTPEGTLLTPYFMVTAGPIGL